MPHIAAKSIVTLTLAAHVAAAFAVILGYQVTGSSALLSLAILLLVVVTHHAILLTGVAEAGRPADARHPFGHTRELYFWSFVAAILLFAHGAGVAIFEGVHKLKAPPAASLSGAAQALLCLAVVAQAGVAYGWIAAWPTSAGEDEPLTSLRDPVRSAVAVDNVAASIGVLVALAGINAAAHSGIAAGDALASLGIGFIMAAVAAVMCVRTKSIIVGAAAGPAMRSTLRGLIQAEAGLDGTLAAVHDIKTLELGGGDVLVAAQVSFKEGETARSVAHTSARLEESILAVLPQVSHVFLAVQVDEAPVAAEWAPAPARLGTATDGPAGLVPTTLASAVHAADGLEPAPDESGPPHTVAGGLPAKGRKKKRRH